MVVFAEQLRGLFAAAGSPSLAAVSEAVKPICAVSRQRLSDWRSGRHVPSRFEDIEPTLAYLITSAHGREQETVSPFSGGTAADSTAVGEVADAGGTERVRWLGDLDRWRVLWLAALTDSPADTISGTTSPQRGPSSLPLVPPSVVVRYQALPKPVARMILAVLCGLVLALAVAVGVISALTR
ncbi:hypothetical protein TTY48_24500 [Tsukamurella sp. TY48]|uniref:hypothetical protein n=1 Tax=Tsukamurella TaxID=2060 RepID=UPI001C7DB1D7|nr:hypothetical protein [Tsukamurella sp. TY48]GIZ97838.1 hypothetical protein TTY48_24500 [Tsukamurella sp. TY48]